MTNSVMAMSMAVNHGLPLSESVYDKSFMSKSPGKNTRRVSVWNPFGNVTNLLRPSSAPTLAPDRDEVVAMLLAPRTETAKIGRRKTLNVICNTNNSTTQNDSGMAWEEVRKILREEGVTTNYATLQLLHHRKSFQRSSDGCSNVNGTKCDVLSKIGVSLLSNGKHGQRKKHQHHSSPSLKARTQELILEHTQQVEFEMLSKKQKEKDLEKKKRYSIPSISPFVSKKNTISQEPILSQQLSRTRSSGLMKNKQTSSSRNVSFSDGSKSGIDWTAVATNNKNASFSDVVPVTLTRNQDSLTALNSMTQLRRNTMSSHSSTPTLSHTINYERRKTVGHGSRSRLESGGLLMNAQRVSSNASRKLSDNAVRISSTTMKSIGSGLFRPNQQSQGQNGGANAQWTIEPPKNSSSRNASVNDIQAMRSNAQWTSDVSRINSVPRRANMEQTQNSGSNAQLTNNVPRINSSLRRVSVGQRQGSGSNAQRSSGALRGNSRQSGGSNAQLTSGAPRGNSAQPVGSNAQWASGAPRRNSIQPGGSNAQWASGVPRGNPTQPGGSNAQSTSGAPRRNATQSIGSSAQWAFEAPQNVPAHKGNMFLDVLSTPQESLSMFQNVGDVFPSERRQTLASTSHTIPVIKDVSSNDCQFRTRREIKMLTKEKKNQLVISWPET